MRIGCLQFAPQVGDVNNNLNRADAVLSKANPQNLDLLVLPELAFSGYNFKSLQQISPFLEPTTAGITSLWARTTALKYECVVTVGYPEKVDITPKWPASPEYYNSAITVNADGETIANYRKSFLYYTDETWALEGPDGFFDGEIEGLGNVAMGICMDLNPYKFESPWSAWEFAYHILHKEANLVILSMAWLTREDARSYSRSPKDPDMQTLSYWLARLEPLIRAETEGEIIVVLANRCGTEEEAVYAGTSAVLGIQGGEVKVYGILGRGERELLIVDTNKRPQAKLISEPNSTASHQPTNNSNRDSDSSNPRTHSMVSDNSVQSSSTDISNLSVTTSYTSMTSPNPGTPDAMDTTLDTTFGNTLDTMDEIITPLSPVDPNSPNTFFAPKGRLPDPCTLQESLQSSIGRPQHAKAAEPGSPSFVRPPSPKSRNASRTRQPEYQEPALISHDLAQEPQLTTRSFGVKSPPHSASAIPDQNQTKLPASGIFGPRSQHVVPRPKSMIW